MQLNKNVKIVYVDNNITRVLKGTIIAEDEHTYEVKCDETLSSVVIGKRALIRINEVSR